MCKKTDCVKGSFSLGFPAIFSSASKRLPLTNEFLLENYSLITYLVIGNRYL